MFQVESGGQNNITNILEQELDSFNTILQFSEKFVEQVNSLPVGMLSKMVHYRQEWIDKIQKLEERRKSLGDQEKNKDNEAYLKNISQIAEKLVQIDKQIYDGLQKRKIDFIKEHSGRAGMTQSLNKQGSRPSRLDIVQE